MSDIREYWEERAQASKGTPQATTDDFHLRDLEIRTLVREVGAVVGASQATLLDVGCGDGRSLLAIAEAIPNLQVLGLDYSKNMIALADAALKDRKPELSQRARFKVGDLLKLEEALGGEQFDVVVTMRCLINLRSDDDQAAAIDQIAAHIRPGGWYFGTENFLGGQNAMNALRRHVGLDEIAVRWHNHFFSERALPALFSRHFESVDLVAFSSSYYYATRVIYSKMCKMLGEEPDYDHPIHQLAVDLPPMGDFSPIKLIRARRKSQD